MASWFSLFFLHGFPCFFFFLPLISFFPFGSLACSLTVSFFLPLFLGGKPSCMSYQICRWLYVWDELKNDSCIDIKFPFFSFFPFIKFPVAISLFNQLTAFSIVIYGFLVAWRSYIYIFELCAGMYGVIILLETTKVYSVQKQFFPTLRWKENIEYNRNELEPSGWKGKLVLIVLLWA